MGGRGSSADRNSVKLEQYGRATDMYKTLFPLPSNREEANEIAKFNFRLGEYSDIDSIDTLERKVETIDLSKLSNNQETVRKEQIDSLLKLGKTKIEQIQDKSTSSELPYIIRYGSTNLIMDGHHRLTALRALGSKKTKVLVFDLSKYRRKR